MDQIILSESLESIFFKCWLLGGIAKKTRISPSHCTWSQSFSLHSCQIHRHIPNLSNPHAATDLHSPFAFHAVPSGILSHQTFHCPHSPLLSQRIFHAPFETNIVHTAYTLTLIPAALLHTVFTHSSFLLRILSCLTCKLNPLNLQRAPFTCAVPSSVTHCLLICYPNHQNRWLHPRFSILP